METRKSCIYMLDIKNSTCIYYYIKNSAWYMEWEWDIDMCTKLLLVCSSTLLDNEAYFRCTIYIDFFCCMLQKLIQVISSSGHLHFKGSSLSSRKYLFQVVYHAVDMVRHNASSFKGVISRGASLSFKYIHSFSIQSAERHR